MNKAVIGISSFILLLTISMAAIAEDTRFKQQIVPIDCLYEVIDVGTQKLRYLTPETCPVDPGPPIVTEPSTEESPQSTGTRWEYNAPIVIAPQPQNNTDTEKEVAGSIEEKVDIVYLNRDSIIIVVALVITSWVVMYIRHYSKSKEF